jgi:hypothetical protein
MPSSATDPVQALDDLIDEILHGTSECCTWDLGVVIGAVPEVSDSRPASVRTMTTAPFAAIPTQARTVQGICLILGPLLNAAATFFRTGRTDGRHGVVGGVLVAWSCVL